MLRLVVCCGAGMSSSILATKFQEEIKANDLQEKVSIVYMAMPLLMEKQADFDLALMCPHLRYHAINAVKSGKVTLPFYLIPSRLYGTMKLLPLLEDAIDLFKIYKETHENPVHFPDESLMVNDRYTSHRRWLELKTK